VLSFAERKEIFRDRLEPVMGDIATHVRSLRDDPGMSEDLALATYIELQTYQRAAADFVRAGTGDAGLADGEALAAFAQLPLQRQNQSVFATLAREVSLGGQDGASSNSFNRAYSAIDALYPPNAETNAGIRLLVSQITTLDGGGIDLFTPYGGVNAGIANTAQINKSSDELGVIARGRGDINAVARDTFQTNSTRVFTLDGGDILIWSSLGDVDAGSGANLNVSAATRAVTFDKHGNALINFPPTVASAGIRALVSTPGTEPGDVYLFAPQGIIDAGDAGIGAAGNLTLAATEVVGADNIDVAGISVGVPVAPAGPPPGLSGVSAITASVTKAAQESASSVSVAEDEEGDLAILHISVLSFGDEEDEQAKEAQ
jgi:hypothetical protein